MASYWAAFVQAHTTWELLYPYTWLVSATTYYTVGFLFLVCDLPVMILGHLRIAMAA